MIKITDVSAEAAAIVKLIEARLSDNPHYTKYFQGWNDALETLVAAIERGDHREVES